MRFYSKHSTQSFTYYPWLLDLFQAALTVHNFHSLESIPCQASLNNDAQQNTFTEVICIPPGTHSYPRGESSNVEKLSCSGTKVTGNDENRTQATKTRVKCPYQSIYLDTSMASFSSLSSESL